MDSEGPRPFYSGWTGYENPVLTEQVNKFTEQIATWKRERDEFELMAKFLLQRRCGGIVTFPVHDLQSVDPRLTFKTTLKDGMVTLQLVPV